MLGEEAGCALLVPQEVWLRVLSHRDLAKYGAGHCRLLSLAKESGYNLRNKKKILKRV